MNDRASASRRRAPTLRWVRRIVVGAFGLVAVGVSYQAIGSWLDARSFPPPGQLVDVGDGRLHLHCIGEGDPTVVFDAGGGDTSLVWREVQEAVATRARACVFDRMGFGHSDAFDLPHTVDAYVRTQDRLLSDAGLEPPFVLVGHSLGGLNAQVLARERADDVAGLVLVDAAHPDSYRRLPALTEGQGGYLVSMRIASRLGVVRALLSSGLVDPFEGIDVRNDVRRAYVAQLSRPRHWDAAHAMSKGLGASMREAPRVAPPPDVPVVVLMADEVLQFPGVDPDEVRAIWTELQAEAADRFPDGRLVVAEGSGHLIPLERPDAVVAAVMEVLDRHAGGS